MFWSQSSAIRSWLPRLQSHRGYWVEGLQQNSLSSIQEAYKRGFLICEFDVRLTRDQAVVLFHDEKYNGHFVEKTEYDDFKNLIHVEFPQLSKLEEVFDWMRVCRQKDANFFFKLNIEIKSNKIFDDRLEKKVCELIEKFELADQILISSFNPFSLFRIRLWQPRVFRALLVTHEQESNFLLNHFVFNILALPHVLHLRWNDLSQKIVRQTGEKVPIVLWTVNDISIAIENKKYIFGVISDQITPQSFMESF